MDIITARGQAALVQAESHLSGALSQYVHETREKLKEFITKLEVTIDYPEEDLEILRWMKSAKHWRKSISPLPS